MLPQQDAPASIEFAFDISQADLLHGLWMAKAQMRNRVHLVSATKLPDTSRQRLARWLKPFALGCCLGIFHLNAACWVLLAAAVAFGMHPQIAPESLARLGFGTGFVGMIWMWLLAGPAITEYRFRSGWIRRWRSDLPEILQGPLPASVSLSADQAILETLNCRDVAPIGPSIRLIEADDYCLLKLRGALVPIAKNKLSPDVLQAVRGWAMAHNLLFHPVRQRHIVLPTRVSALLGVVLCLCCFVIATHMRVVPQPPIYPTSVTLALPDATMIVAGQVVHLEDLSYGASDFNGVLYDQLSGYISRPDISGTFHMDRSATPYLAQTADDEYNQERTWNLTIGKIPDNATMYALPDSGVFIAWENSVSADYPGRCGALRSNYDTSPAPAGRVLWRGRLYVQVCSAAMSASELREWMMQAIKPMYRQLVSRTKARG